MSTGSGRRVVAHGDDVEPAVSEHPEALDGGDPRPHPVGGLEHAARQFDVPLDTEVLHHRPRRRHRQP